MHLYAIEVVRFLIKFNYGHDENLNIIYKCANFHDAQIDSHVFPLYDAIMLYATAINNSLANGVNINDGLAVAKQMKNMWFPGKIATST